MMPPDKQISDFIKEFSVNPEIIANLRLYADMLVQWNKKINLVSQETIPDLWRRHIADSWQLLPYLGSGVCADFGSGAGFPGLVLAIGGDRHFHLVESDQRKSAFLLQVAAATKAKVTIHAKRIEDIDFKSNIMTARALAPVGKILSFAQSALEKGGKTLLLKGEKAEAELTEAAKDWMFSVKQYPSRTDPRGVILELSDIDHARPDHRCL